MRKKWTKRIIVPAFVLFIALLAGATIALAEVAPPTDLAAATAPMSMKSAGISTVTLTWNYAGAEEPKHFRIQSASFNSGVKTITVPGGFRAYTLSGLKMGKTYHYRIRTVTASGKSQWSEIVNVVAP